MRLEKELKALQASFIQLKSRAIADSSESELMTQPTPEVLSTCEDKFRIPSFESYKQPLKVAELILEHNIHTSKDKDTNLQKLITEYLLSLAADCKSKVTIRSDATMAVGSATEPAAVMSLACSNQTDTGERLLQAQIKLVEDLTAIVN